MTFQNIYYKRTAATAKACYMCFRSTTTVLATLNTTDFFYACDGHLADRGFATLIEPARDAAKDTKKVNDEEILRITEEWERRQKRIREKEEPKADEKDSKKPDKKNESDTKKPEPKLPPSLTIPVPGSSAAAKAIHQRYTLHRDVWSMRLAEHKKKRQRSAVKEVAPRLPTTPRGGVA